MPVNPNNVRIVEEEPPEVAALRARFAKAPPVKRESVTVDYGDGEPFAVDLVELRGKQRLAWENYSLKSAREEEEAAGRTVEVVRFINLAEHTAALVAATACAPGTEVRIFTGPNDPNLTTIPTDQFVKLSAAANRMNPSGGRAHEEALKPSEEAPSTTTSSSPTSSESTSTT